MLYRTGYLFSIVSPLSPLSRCIGRFLCIIIETGEMGPGHRIGTGEWRDPYLTTAQVAEILGVTKKTIKNWLRSQWIPEPRRNPLNRYRQWTLQDVAVVRQIVCERHRSR